MATLPPSLPPQTFATQNPFQQTATPGTVRQQVALGGGGGVTPITPSESNKKSDNQDLTFGLYENY
jgi:hypothetical protein